MRYLYERFPQVLGDLLPGHYHARLSELGLLTRQVIQDAVAAEYTNDEWSLQSDGFKWKPTISWMIYNSERFLTLPLGDHRQLVLELATNPAYQPDLPGLLLHNPKFMTAVFGEEREAAVLLLTGQCLARFDWIAKGYPDIDRDTLMLTAAEAVTRGMAGDRSEEVIDNLFQADDRELMALAIPDPLVMAERAPFATLKHVVSVETIYPEAHKAILLRAASKVPTRLTDMEHRRVYRRLPIELRTYICAHLEFADDEGEAYQEAFRLLGQTVQDLPEDQRDALLQRPMSLLTKQNAPEAFLAFIAGMADSIGLIYSERERLGVYALKKHPLWGRLVAELERVHWDIGYTKTYPDPVHGPRQEIRYECGGGTVRLVIPPRIAKRYQNREVLYPTTPPPSHRITFSNRREVGYVLELPIFKIPA